MKRKREMGVVMSQFIGMEDLIANIVKLGWTNL